MKNMCISNSVSFFKNSLSGQCSGSVGKDTSKCDALCLIPGTHTVERTNFYRFSFDPHIL